MINVKPGNFLHKTKAEFKFPFVYGLCRTELFLDGNILLVNSDCRPDLHIDFPPHQVPGHAAQSVQV